jgi:hypothetical protein
MKLVIGMPVKDRSWILPVWFKAVNENVADARSSYANITHTVPSVHLDVEIVALYTDSEDDTKKILEDNSVVILHDTGPGRTAEEINRHLWGTPMWYEYMAHIRNELLDWAGDHNADWFFSLDSDVILAPGALRKLLQFWLRGFQGILSPAVDMCTHLLSNQRPEWNRMHWTKLALIPERKREELGPNMLPVRADVVMAALLFDKVAMENAYWTVDSHGEDIGLCRVAKDQHISRWWVPSIVCEHRMHKPQAQPVT